MWEILSDKIRVSQTAKADVELLPNQLYTIAGIVQKNQTKGSITSVRCSSWKNIFCEFFYRINVHTENTVV